MCKTKCNATYNERNFLLKQASRQTSIKTHLTYIWQMQVEKGTEGEHLPSSTELQLADYTITFGWLALKKKKKKKEILQATSTYKYSLLYVKPMKGRWLPAKALGGWNVSSGWSSFSISSKLLVSTSLESSGITGGTAARKGMKNLNLTSSYSSVFSISIAKATRDSSVLIII